MRCNEGMLMQRSSGITEYGEVVMGYGRCSVSGCPCASFQQTYGSELCNNCGHQYTGHW